MFVIILSVVNILAGGFAIPRSNRLFDLIAILRDGRLHRAQDLADRLSVSLRTIYRDMDTLVASGVPIAGERGLGYMATAAITLPPLNLSAAELGALRLGLGFVFDVADDATQTAAQSLLAKIEAVLPEDATNPTPTWGLAVYPFAEAAKGFQHMPVLRAATRARQKLAIEGPGGAQVIRPLHLDYWGRVWTVTGWSETEASFRVIRVDQITSLRVLPQLFVDEAGKGLDDFVASQSPG
jgi:predicted DNA-binding transcriptional regulator YafY